MDRNYIIYNNRPFTLIWHLAFGAFLFPPQTMTRTSNLHFFTLAIKRNRGKHVLLSRNINKHII